MRYVGRITDWNDDKGFGFVTPNGGGDRAFVHVKAFTRQGRRPVTGDLIAYEVRRDPKGRLNAASASFAGARGKQTSATRPWLPRRTIAGLAFAVLAAGWWLHALPVEVVFVYVALSGIALFAYAFDKSAAERGRWRTAESTLHAIALLGGWPGALLAQGLFRHKSRKTEFQVVFWITVVVNGAGLAWILRSGTFGS